MRADEWKMVAYRSGKMELFNLEEDISKKNDLAAAMPEKVNELTEVMNQGDVIPWANREKE